MTLTVTDNGGANGSVSKPVSVGTSADIGWVSPVSFEDPSGSWVVEERSYDDDIDGNYNTSAMHYGSTAGEWTSHIILRAPSGGLQCDRIRLLVGDSAYGSLNLLAWSIDVYRDDAWVNVYTGTQASLPKHRPSYAPYQWTEISFAQGLVTRVRLRAFNHNSAGSTIARIYELDFHDSTAAP